MSYRTCIIVVLLCVLSTRVAHAGLLAYDGFNYPPGLPIAGGNGGYGWSNGWVDVSGNAGESVVSGNLSAGFSAPVGFDARSAGNAVVVNSNSRCGRWLDCSPGGVFAHAGLIDASGNIGADGKTVYLSFLQQPSSTIKFYEFEFHRNDLGDSGRLAGIGNDTSDNNVYLRSEVPAGGNSTFWNLGVGSTNVNFYVVRIDFKAGNDDVYIYRNPTSDVESNNEPVLTMLSLSDMSFDGISFGAYLNGVTVKHDEIRVGTTWASVLGNPPEFVLQPTNQNLYAGQSVTLDSLAQSAQPLKYQWYHSVNGNTNALLNETNASLMFPGAQLNDAGEYFVTATNSLGMAISATATLTVQPISIAIDGPLSVPTGAGSNLVIQASTQGAQPLTYQWYKNGDSIEGATGATLDLGDKGFFNAGQYVMVASNAYGSITSSIVNVYPAVGGLLAYEGFDYPQGTGNLIGQSGGFGWSGAWITPRGASGNINGGSMLAGNNAPVGYDSLSAGNSTFQPAYSQSGRFLDCSPDGSFGVHGYIDDHGNIGADGKTLYISFLQQPNVTSLFYEFEFHRGGLGDSTRIGGVGNDTTDKDVHLRAEVPPGGNSTYWDLGAGNTNVNLYVVRIDYKAGNDDVFVYRNPTSSTEPPTPTLVISNVADMSFDAICLGTYYDPSVAHDEIRFGMTWRDVIGGTMSQLQLTQRTNNVSNLLLAGSPNYAYQLQTATNVTGPWTNIANIVLPNLGINQFIETNSSSDRCFYRSLTGAASSAPSSTNVVFADFEQATYGDWVTTGTAFGSGPAQGTLPNQQTVSGYVGSGLVNSFLGGDGSTGTLTSPSFVINKPYLNFLIGGGNHPGQECMNLIVSNVVVETATGSDDETLMPRQWDVSAYLGQTARLQIVDSLTGGWGHINVDQITFSETPLPSLTREMFITNRLLNLPVQNGAAMRRITVTVNGQPVRDFNIRLSTGGTPDWWAFVDVSEFTNQTATLAVSSLSSISDGFYQIVQTNGIVGATNLYQETLRPQLHFSTKRGWLNDANGMFYYHGQYHLYYQHDPFAWDGSGQKWWGHAASPDMVNWRELPEGIYSHSYGDEVYSGSAVVDANNTGGFKTGTNDVIVAAYYSTARGECIAYSNDGGLSFTDYASNPVVVHSGTGRDPHIFWYAPSNYWVMAVYDDSGGNGIQFYSTPDFRAWTFRSKIYNGFFECPDLFELPVDGDTNNMTWLLCDGSSGYQLGQFDGVTFTPDTSKLPGNSGSGFYASQTFTSMAPGDRRIVRIGWAQIATPGMPFNEMMYFPTELNLQTTTDGVRLCSTPIAEITNNAVNVYAWTNLDLSPGYNPLAGIRGTLFDVKAEFTVGSAQAITFVFQNVTVTYNTSTQQISCNGDTQSLPPVGGSVQLEIIVDRDTIEIYGNDGQLYMPLPAGNATGDSLISLTCAGGNVNFNSLTVNKLKSIWTGSGH